MLESAHNLCKVHDLSFLFMNASDFEASKKTADNHVQIATESIEYCLKEFGINYFAVCSDNDRKS